MQSRGTRGTPVGWICSGRPRGHQGTTVRKEPAIGLVEGINELSDGLRATEPLKHDPHGLPLDRVKELCQIFRDKDGLLAHCMGKDRMHMMSGTARESTHDRGICE